jgi:hypothetical protein
MEKASPNGSKSYGTSLAFEFIAIENQLEIEVGAQYLSSSRPKEMGAQIIFKKPFELAPNVELGLGLGPAFSREIGSPSNTIKKGITFAADFMFWNTKRVGWYLSPGYTYGIGANSEKSFGVSIGLLFGI